MKKILFGLGVFLPILALATTFPSSGIDFSASSIEITGPAGATCMRRALPTTYSFSEMGISESTPTIPDFGDWNDQDKRCFQQAGNYTIKMTILDKAGNQTDIPASSFVITSDTPSENTSGFTVSCNDTVANASDTCSMELVLRDKFSNDIEQVLPNIELSAPLTENAEDANLETQFRTGLRIQGHNFIPANPVSFSWNESNPFIAAISAIAPSLHRVSMGIPDTYLSSVVSRTINMNLENLSEINTNGDVSTAHFDFSNPLPAMLQFGAPVAVIPGFAEERISFEEPMEITAEINRPGTVPSDSVISLLKSVSAHEFYEPDAVEDPETGMLIGGAPLNETFTFSPINNGDIQSIEKRTFQEGKYGLPTDISLITDAEYTLDGMPVKYPAGAIGENLLEAAEDLGLGIDDIIGFNPVGVAIRNIGVSIEGIVVGDYDQMYLVGGDKNKMTALSSMHSVDIREKIIKNAYQLIRNATDIKTEQSEFDWDLFDDQDVVIVDLSDKDLADATLTLSGGNLPSGQTTLIVVNGNIHFTGNHEYTDASNDSFGLILLRDKAGPEPERGNIFVHSDVQKLSGALFADGSFFNGDTVDVSTANTGPRVKQLRLVGSLLARNTVGGSRRVGAGYFFTPWDKGSLSEAKRYDIHEIREFDYDDIDNRDANCVKNGADCEENIAAFILRLDQKSTLLPPPAFLTD